MTPIGKALPWLAQGLDQTATMAATSIAPEEKGDDNDEMPLDSEDDEPDEPPLTEEQKRRAREQHESAVRAYEERRAELDAQRAKAFEDMIAELDAKHSVPLSPDSDVMKSKGTCGENSAAEYAEAVARGFRPTKIVYKCKLCGYDGTTVMREICPSCFCRDTLYEKFTDSGEINDVPATSPIEECELESQAALMQIAEEQQVQIEEARSQEGAEAEYVGEHRKLFPFQVEDPTFGAGDPDATGGGGYSWADDVCFQAPRPQAPTVSKAPGCPPEPKRMKGPSMMQARPKAMPVRPALAPTGPVKLESLVKISDAELARVRKLKYLTDENGWKTYPLKLFSRAEMMLHRSVCNMVRHQEHMRVDKIGRVP